MMKKLGLAVVLFALSSVGALAADVSGKWTGETQGRMGPQTMNFDFHVDGSTLTGTITTMRGDTPIKNGKVDGDTISFDQVMDMNGNSMTINYKGVASGDTINFTRTMTGMGDRPPTTFVAKKGTGTIAPPPAQ